MTTLAYALVKPRTRSAYLDVGLVVAGSVVVALLAQLSIRLPFTPVPVTGQTLGVLLVAAALGPVRGAMSLLLYLAEGSVGLPVFAEGKSGFLYLVRADPLHTTGGYLWGFVAAAFLVGLLAQNGWDRSLGSALGAMLLGEIVIFTIGAVWLAAALGVPVVAPGELPNDALDFGVYPFVVGDLLKLLLAAGGLPLAWRLVGRERLR